MLDRDISLSFFSRYIRSYKNAATRQRADTEHERSAAVSHHGSRSARVHHHRPGYIRKMFSEHAKGHDKIRRGYEHKTTSPRNMPVYR